MKKLLFSISGLIAYPLLAVPAFAVGADPCANNGGTNTTSNAITIALCKLSGDNIGTTIQNIVIFIIVIAVVIALLYLLYGGIKWIMSRGDKAEVEAARNHITAAIIGLIIVFLAIFIVTIVMALFGLKLTNLQLPSIVVGNN